MEGSKRAGIIPNHHCTMCVRAPGGGGGGGGGGGDMCTLLTR